METNNYTGVKPWDGVYNQYRYRDAEGKYIDDGGTVYYADSDGVLRIWCCGSRLNRHLRGLWNITRGASVENMVYIAEAGRNW